ncbi:MAG: ankyrin repeat domain-containing protein [Gammaproteobacteria bacterium]
MGRRLALFLLLGLVSLASVHADAEPVSWQQAIHRGDLKTIKRLLPQSDPNQTDAGGKTALMAAAAGPDPALLDALLERGAEVNAVNDRGGNALMYAALKGHPVIIEKLIRLGADVRQRGTNGWTALTIACAKGHLDTVKALLDAGADANARDVYGWTPLMRAVDHNRLAVVAFLLKHPRVKPELPNVDGQSAEDIATTHGSPEAIGLFLSR